MHKYYAGWERSDLEEAAWRSNPSLFSEGDPEVGPQLSHFDLTDTLQDYLANRLGSAARENDYRRRSQRLPDIDHRTAVYRNAGTAVFVRHSRYHDDFPHLGTPDREFLAVAVAGQPTTEFLNGLLSILTTLPNFSHKPVTIPSYHERLVRNYK